MAHPFADGDRKGAGITLTPESLAHLGRNWVWDLSSDKMYWSDELVRLYGIDPATFDGAGASAQDFIHPEDLHKRERAIADTLLGKKVEPYEFRVRHRDGTERVALVKDLQLLHGADGRASYMVGVVQDITELKQLEKELKLLSAELEMRVQARTVELEHANSKLQELDRLKSMFIAMTSHELRTPLNSILGFISMTLHGLSGELNEEQKDNLSRAYGSALHLLSLVTEVIDLSKLEAGKTEAYPEEVGLAELVAEAAGGVRPDLSLKGLSLEVDVAPEITLFTDRKRLLQCLINLVGNAVKYTVEGGITVAARAGGGKVEVSVADTGIGMAERDLDRLFHPFERLDSPLRVKTGGTGLGLYLTRKLCTDILKGDISVRSRPGKGSTFTITVAQDISNANGGGGL
jgi:PAS domain S-box-containing protein